MPIRRHVLMAELTALREMVSAINSALIVREPGTALAAEAYDGLRRQVAQATSERRAHLVELSRLLDALDKGVSGEQLQRLVASWAEQTGLRRWSEPEPEECFEIMTEGSGDGPLEVVHPAWVAGDPPMLVRPGLARRIGQAMAAPSETEETTDPLAASDEGSAAEAVSQETDGDPDAATKVTG